MKIKVEFTQFEKAVIADLAEDKLDRDLREVCTGDFGHVVYNPEGSIDVELKSEFISDICDKLTSLKFLFRSLIEKWDKNTKNRMFDKDGTEVVLVHNPDGTHTIGPASEVE